MKKISRFLYKNESQKKSSPQLVIRSGLSNRQFHSSDLRRIKSAPGFIIKENSVETWFIDSIEEEDEGFCFSGPFIEGKSLANVKSPDEKVIKQLLRFFDFYENSSRFESLGDSGDSQKQTPELPKLFSTESFYLCNNGDLLILPVPLMNHILLNLTDSEKAQLVYPYTHPSLKGVELFSFFISIIFYRGITGDLPFSDQSSEDHSFVNIREKIRKGYFKKIALYRKDPDKKTVSILEKTLKSKIFPGRAEWENLLLSNSSPVKLLSGTPDNHTNLIKKREQYEKREKRSLFLRKQSKTIIFSLLGILVVGLFLGMFLKSFFKPSPINGLSSREVVETFYGCFDSLDDSLMKSCIAKRKVAKKDLRALSYISVLSKQKEAYFGESGLLKASQWDKNGRPPVEPFVNLFGITDLTVKEISELEYEAEYFRWTTVHSGELITDEVSTRENVFIVGEQVKDKIYLEKRRKRFIIIDIKRKEEIIYRDTVLWEE